MISTINTFLLNNQIVAESDATNNFLSYFITKPILRVYLFGSFARNEATNESDIDLLLELDDTKKIDLFDFIGWKYDLEKIFGKKVDLVTLDSVSKYIKPFIDKDKILIYEKQQDF